MAPATRWGILSAGLICNDFAVAVATLYSTEEHKIVAVAARKLEAAQEFAKIHNVANAYGSYEELVKDPNVDIVYVGSINPQHFPLAKLALENGKHVMCEKPMCMNVKETKALVALAQEKNLFLMEAVWTRHFPAVKKLKEDIDKGVIGEVKQVIVTFGEEISGIDRLKLKELGGGTVLDLGIYCVQFASLVFGGEQPAKIAATGKLNDDGVDSSSSASISYPNGKTATLITHSEVFFPCEAMAIGTKGILKLPQPFWCSEKLETPGGTLEFPLPPTDKRLNFEGSVGLAYQCNEVRRCLLNGLIESPVVPHNESILMAQIMESIRKQVGVVYPQDD